ncbi:MAG: preprotein translocase subunit SecE [Flavobacteriales bacterium]|nr:preprotein translocase subunit SecE [Flavobacteriales bacterium]
MANLKTYFAESYNELMNKVSWPTWKELQSSSIIVLVTAFIISLIVFAMDYIFGVQNMAGTSFWKGMLGFIYKFIS